MLSCTLGSLPDPQALSPTWQGLSSPPKSGAPSALPQDTQVLLQPQPHPRTPFSISNPANANILGTLAGTQFPAPLGTACPQTEEDVGARDSWGVPVSLTPPTQRRGEDTLTNSPTATPSPPTLHRAAAAQNPVPHLPGCLYPQPRADKNHWVRVGRGARALSGGAGPDALKVLGP